MMSPKKGAKAGASAGDLEQQLNMDALSPEIISQIFASGIMKVEDRIRQTLNG
jgi:hypothetical protein